MADPRARRWSPPSQGIHLVFDRSFLPGDSAMMVPRTADGRVMFAIPWHGHTLVGTTDTPIETAALEPRPTRARRSISCSRQPRSTSPKRRSARDVLSAFAGIRPLVRAAAAAASPPRSRATTPSTSMPSRADDDHRRQVDHLPAHGRGHGRSGGAASAPAGEGRASRARCASTAPCRRRTRRGRWPSTASDAAADRRH